MGLSDRTRWAYRKLGLHDGPTMSYLAEAGLTPYILLDELMRRTHAMRPRPRYLPPSLARRRFIDHLDALEHQQRATLACLDDHTKWHGLVAQMAVHSALEGLDDWSLVAELQPTEYEPHYWTADGLQGLDEIPLSIGRTLVNGRHIDVLRTSVRQRLKEPFFVLGPSQEAGLEISADAIRVLPASASADSASFAAFIACGGEADLVAVRDELVRMGDIHYGVSKLSPWIFLGEDVDIDELTRTSGRKLWEALKVYADMHELNSYVTHLHDACAAGRIDKKYAALLE